MAVTQDRWAAGDLSVRWPGIGGESPEQVATRGSRGLLVRTALARLRTTVAADAVGQPCFSPARR
jgi:hypothetical protein